MSKGASISWILLVNTYSYAFRPDSFETHITVKFYVRKVDKLEPSKVVDLCRLLFTAGKSTQTALADEQCNTLSTLLQLQL
jgi:hypothetical protein